MKIPPEIRIFWWRVINNFMPTKAELRRRHVIQESHCEVCGVPVEDLYHVAVDCPVARFWEATNISSPKTVVKAQWEAPQEGWIKLNSDGSFDTESSSGAGGWELRNCNGLVLAAAARPYESLPDALTAEALAARDGLLLAREQGHNKIILEVDNLSLAKPLRPNVADRSPIAGLSLGPVPKPM
ncbi:hypothetical protein BAE44_0005421 [Dichanthelium oligosanthes]|uniref:RNase H type-1 domain-containing protein n=1 Tax=Dichanthelium oligosanthes TaxID=888268 RepID=A0A1E5W829_9POAL|nr:hypothetical protein BAE44_0005421 [Dichanthelium oligosanthes]